MKFFTCSWILLLLTFIKFIISALFDIYMFLCILIPIYKLQGFGINDIQFYLLIYWDWIIFLKPFWIDCIVT